jgi:hypothetical protein
MQDLAIIRESLAATGELFLPFKKNWCPSAKNLAPLTPMVERANPGWK